MVPALALINLRLLKLLLDLLLVSHNRVILYTHQASHRIATHANKHAFN